MEMLSSLWVICMLYCTEWLGIRQCFALPVPTLTNYHQGYYSKNSWSYRQTRYPEIKYEKFVFPTKQQETMPILAERSGFAEDSSGKIFFPDELPAPANNKRYQFADREVVPVVKTHHRPSTAVSSSHSKWPSLDEMKRMQSSEDGSIRMESPSTQKKQLPTTHTKSETDDLDFDFKTALNSHSPSPNTEATEEERIQEAVQQFYKWLKLSRRRQKNRQNATTKCPDQFQTGSINTAGTSGTTEDNNNHGSGKPDSVISDQSLVAGLKDQKCPEGQIRLENGECRVKVAI